MGMTIDNCIKDLLIQREDFTYELPSAEIDFMIETMRKYQEIEGIINNWKDATLKDEDVLYAFHKIKKVVEDGKID